MNQAQKFLTSFQNIETFQKKQLSEDTRKPWLKENTKAVHSEINKENIFVDDPEKGDTMNPCIYDY